MSWDGKERRKVPRDRSGKPPCPKCRSTLSKVIDSGVEYIDCPEDIYPRQRECLRDGCHHKWYTFEQNAHFTTISRSQAS